MSADLASANAVKRPAGRRWLSRVVVAFALVSLLAALAGLWLLRTSSGRDFVLNRAVGALPQGALRWEGVEGTLATGLAFDGLHYEADGVTVQLRRAEVRIRAAALWARELHVFNVLLASGSVVLPPPAPSEPLKRIQLPDALPKLELPFALRLDDVQVRDVSLLRERQSRAPEEPLESLVVLRNFAFAGSLRDGRIVLAKLALDSDRVAFDATGHVDSAANWATELDAAVRLPLGEGVQPLPATLAVRGDLSDLNLTLDADVGEPAHLRLSATGGLPVPRWTLEASAPKLLPQRLGAEGAPVSIQIEGQGDLQNAELHGSMAQGALRFDLEPSRISFDNGTLTLSPLALALNPGTARITGTMTTDRAEPEVALDLSWSDVPWPAETQQVPVRSSGSARIDGPLSGYALSMQAAVVRGVDRMGLNLVGQGSADALTLQSFDAALPHDGRLNATGRVAWQPEVAFRIDAVLANFDPAWFVPEFPGAVAAKLLADGGVGEGGLFGTFALRDLSGTLRGRALRGQADAKLHGNEHGEAALVLSLGDSSIRAQGVFTENLDASGEFSPLDLADAWPGASGRVRGTFTLGGTREKPDVALHLTGRDLAHGDSNIGSLKLDADIEAGDRGNLVVQAEVLSLAGQNVQSVSFDAHGSRADHRAMLAVQSEAAALDLSIAGGIASKDVWRGTLESLALVLADVAPDLAAWKLDEPVELSHSSKEGFTLAPLCLGAGTEARLCVEARGGGAGETSSHLDLHALPMEPFGPLLARTLDQPAALQGRLDAQGHFVKRADGRIEAELSADASSIDLRLDAASERSLLALSDLKLSAVLDQARATVSLHSAMNGEGVIALDAALSAPLEENGELSGTLELDLPDITALELFTDQLASPQGRVRGRVQISGTRAEPAFDGSVKLAGFATEIPELGIALADGDIALESRAGGAFGVEGTVSLGEGVANVSGTLQPAESGGIIAQLTISGADLALMATPDIHLNASPDLQLELMPGLLKVRGQVEVPFARIDLEQLQSAVSPSGDVVIVDQGEPGQPLTLDVDVGVKLGERVRMRGYGLNGRLGGQLQVRQRPGRVMTARGSIDVGGAYKAYGQDLSITRGHVAYAATPLDNPSLDIRAQRKIDEVTVGIQVRGTALLPNLSLWSEPSMEQAEQLSYLVLGKPLRSASQTDGAQLTQAAAAMGGNLLAQKLGARMGLDEVEVADNRALGGAALTVGKHLSPRLYVAYGVALFGSGQVVTFKYLLSRLWNVQIDSGSENRAAINYRLER